MADTPPGETQVEVDDGLPSREYHGRSNIRSYVREEPGFSLTGYLHHVTMFATECHQAFEAYMYPKVGQTESFREFMLNSGFSNPWNRLRPYIDQWHAELVNAASAMGLLPEVALQLEKMEVAIAGLLNAVNEARKSPPAGQGEATFDGWLVRDRLNAAFRQIDRLQRLWLHFDPAQERVDRAIVPFEDFYRQAVDAVNDLNDAVHKTKADSAERRFAVSRIATVIEKHLTASSEAAVQHALTPELAARVGAVFGAVAETGKAVVASSVTANQHADLPWAEELAAFGANIIAVQSLQHDLTQAVAEARAAAQPVRLHRVPVLPTPSEAQATPKVAATEAVSDTDDSQCVFRVRGDQWEIRFHDERGEFDPLDGFDYLFQLLRSPGTRLFASQLVANRRRNTGTAHEARSVASPEDLDYTEDGPGTGAAKPDDCLSEEALQHLHECIAQAKSDVRDAEARVARAEAEKDEPRAERLTRAELHPAQAKLKAYEDRLRQDTDRRGHSRKLGASDPSRQREIVRHAINDAIERMGQRAMPDCALHFKNNVPKAVGSGFIYNPKPAPDWQTA